MSTPINRRSALLPEREHRKLLRQEEEAKAIRKAAFTAALTTRIRTERNPPSSIKVGNWLQNVPSANEDLKPTDPIAMLLAAAASLDTETENLPDEEGDLVFWTGQTIGAVKRYLNKGDYGQLRPDAATFVPGPPSQMDLPKPDAYDARIRESAIRSTIHRPVWANKDSGIGLSGSSATEDDNHHCDMDDSGEGEKKRMRLWKPEGWMERRNRLMSI